MRRSLAPLIAGMALAIAMTGTATANNPPGDPLPVNGEPNCFGARVSHGASQHGLQPPAKLATFTFLVEELPELFPPLTEFFSENGISVRSVQAWIRINCSDEPLIPNP